VADEEMIVYQVVNLDRQELFFGTTSTPLEKEIERLAKDTGGPASTWQRGDVVHWRPLTPMISASFARQLHREFEKKTPPNKFKVIPTFKEEDGA
jgi:hypothetical protein